MNTDEFEGYTLVFIEDHNTGVQWGDNWVLHAKGCYKTELCNVQFEARCDKVDDAIVNAFGDFIAEGMDMNEARRYLTLCRCTKKAILNEVNMRIDGE